MFDGIGNKIAVTKHAPWHDESVTAVREEANLHLESCQRDATDGMRALWKLLVGVVPTIFQELSTVAKEVEDTEQLVIGMGFHSSSSEDEAHDGLVRALLSKIRQHEAPMTNIDAPSHNKRVSAVRDEAHLHFASYQRDATHGVRSLRKRRLSCWVDASAVRQISTGD